MRVDAFAIRLRPRANMEAADLGARLCQSVAPSLYRCYALVAIPVFALALATIEIAPWLPPVLMWLAKPWLDRTILFVLARAAFGQSTSINDVWQEQRQVWWGQFLRTWTLQRLSFCRSLTQPVIQLEGLSGAELRDRIRQIKTGKARSGAAFTTAFMLSEHVLWFSLVSLSVWFAPQGHEPDLYEIFFGGGETLLISAAFAAAYGLIVFFIEPFFVGAGFALYISRRVELEAWDIEQEFRRAFAA
jgi:hypothetical protein